MIVYQDGNRKRSDFKMEIILATASVTNLCDWTITGTVTNVKSVFNSMESAQVLMLDPVTGSDCSVL